MQQFVEMIGGRRPIVLGERLSPRRNQRAEVFNGAAFLIAVSKFGAHSFSPLSFAGRAKRAMTTAWAMT